MAATVAEPRLGGGLALSVLLHGGLIAAFFLLRPSAPPPEPPVYRVQIIGAAAGAPAIGVVRDQPKPEPVETTPTPIVKTLPEHRKLVPPKAKVKTKPTPAPKAATPLPPAKPVEQTKTAPAPTAASASGGKGADVTNIQTPGIEFPYFGYTDNIVRQIMVRFEQSPVARAALTAELRFTVRRDGSVDPASIQFVTRSGNYSFDVQAEGSIESAANAHAFGPLPAGFKEDILPVQFRFTPSTLR